MHIIIDCTYQLLCLANIIWIRNELLDACYFAESWPKYIRLDKSDLVEGATMRQFCEVCQHGPLGLLDVVSPNITWDFESPISKESSPFQARITYLFRFTSGNQYICYISTMTYRVTAELHDNQFKCIVEYNRDKNFTFNRKPVTSRADYPPVTYVTRSGRFVVQCK